MAAQKTGMIHGFGEDEFFFFGGLLFYLDINRSIEQNRRPKLLKTTKKQKNLVHIIHTVWDHKEQTKQSYKSLEYQSQNVHYHPWGIKQFLQLYTIQYFEVQCYEILVLFGVIFNIMNF